MRLISTEYVLVENVGVDDDWRDGLDATVVDGITRQVTEGKPVNPIRVDSKTDRLTQGRHRLAGHFNAGAREVLAQLVEYESDREREEDTLLENLCRRTLTPDERDRGLRRLWELSEPANDEDDDARLKQSAKAARKSRGDRASEIAAKTGISQRTVERAVAEPRTEPIAPKPPKPKPLEERLGEAAAQLEVIRATVHQCIQEMDSAAKQFDWGRDDVRRRYIQDVSRQLARVGSASIDLKEIAERMSKAKVKVFTAPVKKLGEKPLPGPGARERPLKATLEERVASGGGLKAPARGKRVSVEDEHGRPLLPQVEETANAWADAAKLGVGPSDDDSEAF